MNIGPRRLPGEPVSTHRLRYVRFSFVWLVTLVLALATLLAFRPSATESSAPVLVMFLYVGLPLGTAVALLSFMGFAIGCAWTALLERNTTAAAWWPRVRETIVVIVLSPLVAFAIYTVVNGVSTLQVPFLSRRHSYSVQWAADPIGFMIMLAVWGALGAGLALYLFRRLRRAYAT